MTNHFTTDPHGREILAQDIRELPDQDRPLIFLLIAAVAGLDRTEAAIKNTWASWPDIIRAMNQTLKDFISPEN